MTEQLLLVDEVAAILRVPKNHVYRIAREGKIATIKFGRSPRFTKEAVNEYIAKQTNTAA